MNHTRAALLMGLVALAGCKKDEALPSSGPWTAKVAAGTDLYATLETSQGLIVVQLFSKDAPKTVMNFVGLASGEREWRSPAGEQVKGRALYPGTIFHRVIPDFMIQGGDPAGNGTGDPGYTFEDEFQSGRRFDAPGLLAMANRGPGTNGSQFFITTSTPHHLDGKHTIFGKVTRGYDVVVAISKVATGSMNRPSTPVTITALTLSETPP